jgi:hypothetical protein
MTRVVGWALLMLFTGLATAHGALKEIAEQRPA